MRDRSGVQGAVLGGAHTPETRVRIPPPQPSSMQSRRMSLIEAITNVAVGFGVALLTQIVVFPLFNLEVLKKKQLHLAGSRSAIDGRGSHPASWSKALARSARNEVETRLYISSLALPAKQMGQLSALAGPSRIASTGSWT